MTLNNTNNNKIIIIIIVIIIIITTTINNIIPNMGLTLLVLLFRQLKQFCPECYMNFSVCWLLTVQQGFCVKCRRIFTVHLVPTDGAYTSTLFIYSYRVYCENSLSFTLSFFLFAI